jgi:pseudaminic acid biosynthesis-associated methylase
MNPQEQFWSGEFGDEYTHRNRVDWMKRVPFWRRIMAQTEARSVLDVGCNAGWNLHAINVADRPTVVAVGIDVNDRAVAEARRKGLHTVLGSIYDIGALYFETFDLVCTSGVLIHVAPAELEAAMRNVIAASRRWVLAVEYESDQEEGVLYRGNTDRLWKRPFGRLYEAIGLKLVSDSKAEGFDRCRSWLLEKKC